jgi:hypothetical protein
MNGCAPFRVELERALAGAPGALARLARHEHARACAACRAELSRDLDGLLERLPAPAAPPALAREVLARLADERAPAVARAVSPSDGLDPGDLESLLGQVPAPRVPAGLAARVLEGLAPERAEPRRRLARRGWLASAAAVAASLALWGWSVLRSPARNVELAQGTGADLEADEELLIYAVERWELLQDEDLDLWLASLDPVDELLIEYADGEPWLDDGSRATSEED